MFEEIQPAPADAILGLTEAYKKDPRPVKVNLGVGVYQDEQGHTPILGTVKEAEKRILAAAKTKTYHSISGTPEYGKCVRELMAGEGHELVSGGRACTAHTPGGTAALRIGADFLKLFAQDATVWVSSPTWANHKGIFTAAGFRIKEYPYYDAVSKGLDFEAMKKALRKVPAEDIVLLHACCHNPTGVDLTPEQWKEVSVLARDAGWLPFVDFAYQGFGGGLEGDRAAILALAGEIPEMLVASSFSKNFGLYRDRAGALTVMASTPERAAAAFSHVQTRIRVSYSNPPAHGGLIVQTILSDASLRKEWLNELSAMRNRIASLRAHLVEGLRAMKVPGDYSFIQKQHGMFSFSGLNDQQVAYLRDQKAIYMVGGGRINVAGLNDSNMKYVCESIAEAVAQKK
ncbi:MAG TPA: amino acid aminotransferase [Kiritimatiellia bacterium]|nr:amino acid aminotransferase [Kiritimatiellia bacterium]HNS81631.1 amino acid aminotransferase [Kiritimatiellia bacterium]